MDQLQEYCDQLGRQAKEAARLLGSVHGAAKNSWLQQLASALTLRTAEIIEANQRDVQAAEARGLAAAAIDRLKLNPARIEALAASVRAVAALPDPVGRMLSSSIRPNGLEVRKVGVPLGVIFFIYESRPNVTIDAAALCVKSGNAIILRGGSEALQSNTALARIIYDELERADLPVNAVQLVTTTDRAAVGRFLALDSCIDLAIPRGGEDLIRRVTAEARMPVLKHYQGNCHVYVDRDADLGMAERIIVNAKCQRPGVCNAAESLLVHRDVASAFLPRAADLLKQKGVELRGCPTTRRLVPDAKAASDDDYFAEFLDLILAVRVVDDLDQAIAHINHYGSRHSDAIVTADLNAARRFTSQVDASAVLVNASTRFNDGFELGLGAEIGISTDKFHARGPSGLEELTTYKYVVYGEGQVRE